eukprot:RCo013987
MGKHGRETSFLGSASAFALLPVSSGDACVLCCFVSTHAPCACASVHRKYAPTVAVSALSFVWGSCNFGSIQLGNSSPTFSGAAPYNFQPFTWVCVELGAKIPLPSDPPTSPLECILKCSVSPPPAQYSVYRCLGGRKRKFGK